MSPLAAGVRTFAIDSLAPEPWQNGGGVTRTVARHDVDGENRWRISAAEITSEGAFSTFHGLDREAVLLQGDGVTLRSAGGVWNLREVGDSARFSGDFPLRGSQIGASARLWNVMVRRKYLRMQTRISRASGPVGPVGEGALLILGGEAELAVEGEVIRLMPGEGVVFSGVDVPAAVTFPHGDGHWLLTTFQER